jgi:pilus assembly protein CpaE
VRRIGALLAATCAMNNVGAELRVVSLSQKLSAMTPQTRVGYVEGSIGGPDKVLSLGALFPDVEFTSVGHAWPAPPIGGLAALIVGAEPRDADEVIARLSAEPGGLPVIVALREADLATTRRLIRAGAADILPTPVTEAALALSLERLLARSPVVAAPASTGQVIALLKAGGGTGATALGTQLAVMLAGRDADTGVCFADLDLQFGLAALYLDLADAITLTDILGGGGALEEAPLASAIARHRSGVRLLAAPRELAPLETLTRYDVESLVAALKRDFAVTLLDLPSVWTAWTNQALQLSDRILLITELSVSHINLVKRQLKVLAAQNLGGVPVTLVCNKLSGDQQAVVSMRTAEKALGRPFDIVIPEDRRLMNEAIAQGRELSSVRPGSKLAKAIGDLATKLVPVGAARPERSRKLWR